MLRASRVAASVDSEASVADYSVWMDYSVLAYWDRVDSDQVYLELADSVLALRVESMAYLDDFPAPKVDD